MRKAKKLKKLTQAFMVFYVVSIFFLNIAALGAEAVVADIIGQPQAKIISSLIELNPRERHELKPAQESIANFFVRSIQPLPNNRKQVEWCVATTSNQWPQAYHVRMISIKPFDGFPYTIPEDVLEKDELSTLKLSPDKKTVSADFTTYKGKDGFCAKTTEGPNVPVGKMMMLDVWTNVSKIKVGGQTHSLWPEYSVFLGNEDAPRCEATAANKVYRCRFDAVRTKLIEEGTPLGIVNAQFVKSHFPTTLNVGEQKEVKITMKNTGTSTWIKTGTNPYVLAAKNPQGDNNRWGISKVELPVEDVAAGEEVTFAFNIQAPQKAGNYDFQWQVYQVPVQYFGEIAPNPTVKITVTPPQIVMTPSNRAVASGESFKVTWNVPDGIKTHKLDWITLVKTEAQYTVEYWFYTNGKRTGTKTLKAQTNGGNLLAPGTYELRYYRDNGVSKNDIIARGPQITVTEALK